MVEQFANDALTTLDGAVDDTQTTITVVAGVSFPDAPFRVRIDDEILMVTDASSLNWTVDRGIEGTTASAHTDGSTVSHVLTAGALVQVRAPLNGIEVFEADGTFTVPAGITRLWVEVVGGGGGGGGSEGPGGGNGGCGGGYAAGLVTVTPGDVIPVTIGLGGPGGTGNESGTTGGTSSFGTTMSATGGQGGDRAAVVGVVLREGGVGTGGDINVGGAGGGPGARPAAGVAHASGSGGNSALGGGGQGRVDSAEYTGGRSGAPGRPYGGGGSGGLNGGGADPERTESGGDGANGVVIVRY